MRIIKPISEAQTGGSGGCGLDPLQTGTNISSRLALHHSMTYMLLAQTAESEGSGNRSDLNRKQCYAKHAFTPRSCGPLIFSSLRSEVRIRHSGQENRETATIRPCKEKPILYQICSYASTRPLIHLCLAGSYRRSSGGCGPQRTANGNR